VASLLAEIIETGDVGILDAAAAPDPVTYEIILMPITSQSSIDRIFGAAVRIGFGEPRGVVAWSLTARTILSPDSHVPGPVSIRDARAAAAELAPATQFVGSGVKPPSPPRLRVLDGGLSSNRPCNGPAALGFTDG
jgi:hypothetical protein